MVWRRFLFLSLVVLSVPASAWCQQTGLAEWHYGSGEPLIVTLHGGPGTSHEYLLPEWLALEDAGTLLFYDQRGCGQSGSDARYHWNTHVEDLWGIIDRERPEKLVIAGSSWGAHLALLFALSFPNEVDALVLSGFSGWMGPAEVREDRLPSHLQHRLDSLEAGLAVSEWPLPDTAHAAVKRGAREVDQEVAGRITHCLQVVRGIFDSRLEMPHLYELAKLEVPILIVEGDQEGRLPNMAGQLQPLIPHVRRVVIPGAGHDPWASDPEAFARVVSSFLESIGVQGEPARGGPSPRPFEVDRSVTGDSRLCP